MAENEAAPIPPTESAPETSPEPSLRETLETAVQESTLAADTAKMPQPAPGGRIRDDGGRFVKQEAPGSPPPKDIASGVAKSPAARAPGVTPPGVGSSSSPAPGGAPVSPDEPKAPASWRGGAKELWGTLPSDVKAEITKREFEITRGLQEATEARRALENLSSIFEPYQTFIAADGSTPLEAIQNYLQTAARLRIGTEVEKAQTAYQIITHYGINMAIVDRLLASGGQAAGMPVGQPTPAMDPRYDEIKQWIQNQEREKQEQAARIAEWQQAQVTKSVMEFGKDKEFFTEEVKADMADILEIAERRGVDMTLEDAYNRAVRMNDKYRPIVAQREAAQAARNATASTQRAQAAASSVKSSPATAAGRPSSGGSLRDTLEEVVAESYGR